MMSSSPPPQRIYFWSWLTTSLQTPAAAHHLIQFGLRCFGSGFGSLGNLYLLLTYSYLSGPKSFLFSHRLCKPLLVSNGPPGSVDSSAVHLSLFSITLGSKIAMRGERKKESEVAQSCLTLCNPIDCIVHQAPLSLGFSRQEGWSALPFPSPEDLPNPGIEPGPPSFQENSLPPESPGNIYTRLYIKEN